MGKKRSGAKRGEPALGKNKTVAPPVGVSFVALLASAALVLAFAINAAAPGRAFTTDVTTYWIWGTSLVAAGAALLAWLPMPALRDLPARCGRLLTRPSPLAFAAIVGLTTTALSVVFAVYAFEMRPIAADEFAQLWHAQMIAHGRLSLPVDPNPEFFAIDNVVDSGRWYSQYPIGGPAVLAIGVLFGTPWLVNPVFAGGSAVAIYQFARRAFGEVEGRAIAALFSVTPMVLLMAGSHMNHVPVLFLMSLVLAALVELDRDPPTRHSAFLTAIIGLALGAMATIRPLDAAVAALVVGGFQATLVARNRLRLREVGTQFIAGSVAIVPLLYANWATTGNALRFGYNVLWGATHQIGFHIDPTGAAHTPARALEYAAGYVSDLNVFVAMWPVPGLVGVITTLLMLRRLTRWDAFLLGLFWTQVFAYAAYWHRGHFIGPRFLFTALPAIIVFIARVPFAAADRFGAFGRRYALAAVLGCIAVSWSIPALKQSTLGTAIDIRNSRRIVKVDIEGPVRAANVHNAVVFVREPFSFRLSRRLWGVGVSRGDAASLLARGDACSLLSAIASAEADSAAPLEGKASSIARATVRFTPGPSAVRTTDPVVHINSPLSVTDACRTEIDDDARFGVGSFGPALLLETLESDGRVGGDVVYVSDLGVRNAQLRARFADRTWYRLSLVRPGERGFRAVITPY
ncbi:MAG: hypothetical protein AABZ80_09715 [Gemmatimonadota bacterium]